MCENGDDLVECWEQIIFKTISSSGRLIKGSGGGAIAVKSEIMDNRG